MDSSKPCFEIEKILDSISLASQDLPAPALYIVGLPIGNLGDITLRALWTLSQADFIAAEDTRETKKLLEKFNIQGRLFPVHQHNEHEGTEKILEYLSQGLRVALVTDAGTPAVSDPGSKSVAIVREHGYRVIPVPGASAVITAMSCAGMAPEGFVFHGFLHGGKKERRDEIVKLVSSGRTFVLYEAPHRILKLAEELAENVPAQRKIVIARELTKKFENIESLTASELPDWSKHHEPRGEYVVLVNSEEKNTEEELSQELREWLDNLIPLLPTGQLAAVASKISCLPKKIIYNYILSKKNSS